MMEVPLIFVEGTGHESILTEHIHPYMLIVYPGADGTFQQDSAKWLVTWLEMSNIGGKSMTKTSKYYPGPLIPPTQLSI